MFCNIFKKFDPVALFLFVILLLIIVSQLYYFHFAKDQVANVSRELAFAVIGREADDETALQNLLSEAAKDKAAAVFVSGDLDKKRLEQYQRDYGLMLIPLSAKPTDNEDNLSPENVGQAKVRTLTLNGIRFLLISSDPIENEAERNFDQQLAYLKKELADHPGQPIIIMSGKLDDRMREIHPVLADHGRITVISSDTPQALDEKDSVKYYSTGAFLSSHIPKDKSKPPESYLHCRTKSQSQDIDCQAKQPENNAKKSAAKEEYQWQDFQASLVDLANKESQAFKMGFAGLPLENPISGIRYIVIKKDNSACQFPELGLFVEGTGIYLERKLFDGVDISQNQRLYFLSNNSREILASVINRIYFYALDKKPEYCLDYQVNFFSHDFNQDLARFRSEVDAYKLRIKDKEYEKMLSAIPVDNSTQMGAVDFPYVKGRLTKQDRKYDLEIKNRGLTSYHWTNEKKSYTVKFRDYYDNSKKMLFYIPEKRAYIGEYLMNRLAGKLGLQALLPEIGQLFLNGKDQGLYYISEDFDQNFLAKRRLADANIYESESLKVSEAGFDLALLKKEMFSATVAAFEENIDRDLEHFLQVVNYSKEDLEKTWSRYFDQENITKMLALYSMTGTAHYDLHNLVFYIEPNSGRVFFMPWDFMNYTHAGVLEKKEWANQPNDYQNLNPLFSKLLEIPEIRDRRNLIIYEQAQMLLDELDNFEKNEYTSLYADFLNDQTVAFPQGEGNRPAFVSFMKSPSIIKENILYLKNKISGMDVKGSYDPVEGDRLRFELKSNSFSSIRINKLIIPDLGPDNLSKVFANGGPLVKDIDYTVNNHKRGFLEISFNKKIALSPSLEYAKEYGALIKMKPSFIHLHLELASKHLGGREVAAEIENLSTGESQVISLLNRAFEEAELPVESQINHQQFSHPLLKKISGTNQYTFVSKEVELTENLVLPESVELVIQRGTTVRLAGGASLLSFGRITAKGSEQEPITFTWLNKGQPWGVFALSQEKSGGEFEHCIFEYGGDAYIGGIYFSGMFSGYHCDVSVKNSLFQYAGKKGGDDALNLKSGLFTVEGNEFRENGFDAIDYDFAQTGSTISHNRFFDNGNDGVDASGSENLVIARNFIKGSGDKGISIGEETTADIFDNKIENCNFGIAVKDSSRAKILNSDIVSNNVGVAGYNKKEVFGGVKITVANTLFSENGQDFGLEKIGKDDLRFGHDKFNSSCLAVNSRYRFNNETTKEIIKEPKEKIKSKRKFLEKYMQDDLEDYGFKFAILANQAQQLDMTGLQEYDSTRIGTISNF